MQSLQARRPFVRADEVELARALLDDIALVSSDQVPLLADRGALYAYSAHTGVWTELVYERLVGFLAGYAGARISSRRGAGGVVKLSHGMIKSTIRCAIDLAYKPGYFDNAVRGVAFSNAFLAVDPDGTIRPSPHMPENRATCSFPFAYTPATTAPRFHRFLDEIFRGDADAADKQSALAEFYGACLIGVATKFQRAVVLQGDGANGKGTLINIMNALFPGNAVQSIPPQQMDDPYRRAVLAGVRLNRVSELPEADILHSESFKAIVAGDVISARHPYGRPFQFRPAAGHIFSGNAMPAVSDQTHAFWRRFLVIPFKRIFAEAEWELNLHETVVSAELPGIAAWAIEGASRLLRRGRYLEPASATQAKRDWQEATDQVLQFLHVRTVPAPAPDITAMRLYADYRLWATWNGHSPMSSTKFFSRLRSAGHTPHRDAENRLYRLTLITSPTREQPS